MHVLYEKVKHHGVTMFELIDTSRKTLEAQESSAEWKNYLKYIDDLVMNGFYNAVRTSLTYLLDNMTPAYLEKNDLPPLLETKLELDAGELVYNPNAEEDTDGSLGQLLRTLLREVFGIAALVPRIYTEGSNKSYLDEMMANAALDKSRNAIMDHLTVASEKIVAYRNTFAEYTFLWTENRQEFMRNFLSPPSPDAAAEEAAEKGAATGAAAGKENVPANAAAEEDAHSGKPKESSIFQLDRFETQIRQFETIHKTIMGFDNEIPFDGWLKVDIKPLKQVFSSFLKVVYGEGRRLTRGRIGPEHVDQEMDLHVYQTLE